jgi:Amidohydrolase family
MVKRAWLGLALSWLVAGCGGASREAAPETLVLRGFHLVDVASRSIVDRDVVIENGVVVARPTFARQRVVEGHGGYLMPTLWDLKASLWGNNSTLHWDVLTQEANFTQCLGMHLYYGVAHVGVFGMDRLWAERELKRADALELAAAEPLYPDKAICGEKGHPCDLAADSASARAALDERVRHGAPFVYVVRTKPRKGSLAGVNPAVFAELMTGAAARHLPVIAVVDDWAEAREATELGASVVYGFPDAPVPDSLLELMRARGVAFAPALTRHLELNRLLGNEPALTDPFLTATLQPAVRDSYRTEQNLFQEWRDDLTIGRARQAVMLESVARAASAGVHVVVASDAGWTAGAFQGYSNHAAQDWLERVGLDGWARLSAATVWPAATLGRHVGFEVGQAADFLALDGDPVQSAANLRKIAWVMRKGRIADRDKLLPDLTRGEYVP